MGNQPPKNIKRKSTVEQEKLVIFRGAFQKRGNGWKTWHNRYFLVYEDFSFDYFRGHKSGSAKLEKKGSGSLREVCDVLQVMDENILKNVDLKLGNVHCYRTIGEQNRDWYFQFDDFIQEKFWFNIVKLLHKKRGPEGNGIIIESDIFLFSPLEADELSIEISVFAKEQLSWDNSMDIIDTIFSFIVTRNRKCQMVCTPDSYFEGDRANRIAASSHQQYPTCEQVQFDDEINQDLRYRVSANDYESNPWLSSIGVIRAKLGDEHMVGTAFMIDIENPETKEFYQERNIIPILTAAHCLCRTSTGFGGDHHDLIYGNKVWFERQVNNNQNESDFCGAFRVVEYVIYEPYLEDKFPFNFLGKDLALCLCYDPREFLKHVPKIRVANWKQILTSTEVGVTGFPVDKNGNLYAHSHPHGLNIRDDIERGEMIYTYRCQTSSGQTGAPLFFSIDRGDHSTKDIFKPRILDNSHSTAYGIHTGGNYEKQQCWGTMFDEMKLNWIRERINHVYDWHCFSDKINQEFSPPMPVIEFFSKLEEEGNIKNFMMESRKKKEFKNFILDVAGDGFRVDNQMWWCPQNERQLAEFQRYLFSKNGREEAYISEWILEHEDSDDLTYKQMADFLQNIPYSLCDTYGLKLSKSKLTYEFDAVRLLTHRVMMKKMFLFFMQSPTLDDFAKDEKFQTKIRWMKESLTLENYGIKCEGCGDIPFHLATNYLDKFDITKVADDCLIEIIDCIKEINTIAYQFIDEDLGLVKMESWHEKPELSLNDLLPILVYCIVHSEIKHPHQTLSRLKLFLPPNCIKIGKIATHLNLFSDAVDFIMGKLPSEFGLNDDIEAWTSSCY